MKIHPPPRSDGFDREAIDILERDYSAFSVESDGRYLHWDELRFRPPRPRITHEQWWKLIKLARRAQRRTLPLHDQQGTPFGFVLTDTVLRLVHEIDRDASGRIELPEDVTNQANRDRYVVNSLIEEAFRSSQLEGASTTRHVAKEMLRTKREPRTVSERMILNNFYAMEWVRDNHKVPLTTEKLFELHALVTSDTLDTHDAAGRFRRDEEDVKVIDPTTGEVVHRPPPARYLPGRMRDLCAFANSDAPDASFIHPVIRSILLHFWIAYDHPFVDGNGRTARALFYWSMLKQGYWLTEFISISRVIKKARTQYDRAFLYTETDENDATYFILSQLKVLRQAIDDLFAYLKRKSQEVRDVERKLRGRDDLNNRQLAVLSYVLRHPDARITIEGHQNSHRVVYQTARTDLLDLVRRGFLEQYKSGKRLYFIPAHDLERRIG
jgi:Fic family protein